MDITWREYEKNMKEAGRGDPRPAPWNVIQITR